ncbi:hypothetical protein MRBLMI12_000449 [Microbacterium sp. LMI12-1-1.1]|uniref:hypothetical protein n=1 Tax=Microbacterium sp. LMI12-1-1.1 TaxID=3135225 RepID=UPI0034142247
MQLKLSVTLSLTRAPKPEPEAPAIYEHTGSQVEHAGYQPLGFQIPPSTPYVDRG